jgi:hypothetical protein
VQSLQCYECQECRSGVLRGSVSLLVGLGLQLAGHGSRKVFTGTCFCACLLGAFCRHHVYCRLEVKLAVGLEVVQVARWCEQHGGGSLSEPRSWRSPQWRGHRDQALKATG